eukprot:4402348-Prymnesium_polylepis.1
MPPARDPAGLLRVRWGTDAMVHGARFLAPLTKDGPISVGRSHWLSLALSSFLGTPPVAARRVEVSIRLVTYVFLPGFVLDSALDNMPLPFWPLLAR